MNLVNQPFSDSNEIESQQPEIPKNWYALHVYKNKVSACRDKLNFINKEFEKSEEERSSLIPNELFGGGEQLSFYAPFVRLDRVNQQGKRVVTEKPLIPSLFFIQCTNRQVEIFDQLMGDMTRIYTHLKEGKVQPIAIPLRQMEMFIQVSSGDQEGLEYYGPDAFDWRKGEKVRVIDGRFKGLEGEIKRIDGSKRLIVAIEGICCVATTYIPRCFLEKL